MDDLIEALTIINEYITDDYSKKFPTVCQYEIFLIPSIESFNGMKEEHVKRLQELDFFISEEFDCLASFRYGG